MSSIAPATRGGSLSFPKSACGCDMRREARALRGKRSSGGRAAQPLQPLTSGEEHFERRRRPSQGEPRDGKARVGRRRTSRSTATERARRRSEHDDVGRLPLVGDAEGPAGAAGRAGVGRVAGPLRGRVPAVVGPRDRRRGADEAEALFWHGRPRALYFGMGGRVRLLTMSTSRHRQDLVNLPPPPDGRSRARITFNNLVNWST